MSVSGQQAKCPFGPNFCTANHLILFDQIRWYKILDLCDAQTRGSDECDGVRARRF
jgi:hypothetical protein